MHSFRDTPIIFSLAWHDAMNEHFWQMQMCHCVGKHGGRKSPFGPLPMGFLTLIDTIRWIFTLASRCFPYGILIPKEDGSAKRRAHLSCAGFCGH